MGFEILLHGDWNGPPEVSDSTAGFSWSVYDQDTVRRQIGRDLLRNATVRKRVFPHKLPRNVTADPIVGFLLVLGLNAQDVVVDVDFKFV